MAKAKTSSKLKSLKPKSKKMALKKHDTNNPGFKDARLIKQVLIEALMEDDIETFKDVLIAHLRAQPKTKLASETSLGRQTLYDLINDDIEFNPTLSTLTSILKSIAA
jgi:DNA-binding phage protein